MWWTKINKQGMIFHMASATKLTNMRYRLIQLSGRTMVTAWVLA